MPLGELLATCLGPVRDRLWPIRPFPIRFGDMIDLKHLRAFLCVSEVQSLSRAADLMHRSQPSLSQLIREIERDLGATLFTRTGRGMALTAEGQAFAKSINAPLVALDRAIHRASKQANVSGKVTLGVPPSLSPWCTMALSSAATKQHPGLTLRVLEGHPLHMIDWLQKGELDLALLYGPVQQLHFRLTPLFSDPLVLIGKKTSGLDPTRPVPFKELGTLPLIVPSRPFGIRSLVNTAATEVGISPAIAYEADSGSAIRSMAADGMGYSIQPLSVALRETERVRLAWAPLIDPSLSREIVLAEPSDRPASRAVHAAVYLLAAAVCELQGKEQWQIDVSSACKRLASTYPRHDITI